MRMELETRLQLIVSTLQERITILSNKTAKTPIGLAKVLDLSPHSTLQVTRGSERGIFRSNKLADATPTGKRERFLNNIVQSLKPVIMKICSIPRFRDDRTDPVGVCKMILASACKDSKWNGARVRPKVKTSTSAVRRTRIKGTYADESVYVCMCVCINISFGDACVRALV